MDVDGVHTYPVWLRLQNRNRVTPHPHAAAPKLSSPGKHTFYCCQSHAQPPITTNKLQTCANVVQSATAKCGCVGTGVQNQHSYAPTQPGKCPSLLFSWWILRCNVVPHNPSRWRESLYSISTQQFPRPLETDNSNSL